MKSQDHFHEVDPTGLQTLERFAQADNFNRWLFETIKPYSKGHVLEVGSGIGNLSKFFLKENFHLTVSDLRAEYCEVLRKKFQNETKPKSIERIDLADKNFDSSYAGLLGKFDTVIALNVIEHIKDDALAIRHCRSLLRPDGNLIVLVPAFKSIYNAFDVELGHHKRYTKRSLDQLLHSQGFHVQRSWYFNAVGIMGWVINGALLKKKIVPSGQLKIFNKLVPLVRLVDKISLHSIGLSVIAIGTNPN